MRIEDVLKEILGEDWQLVKIPHKRNLYSLGVNFEIETDNPLELRAKLRDLLSKTSLVIERDKYIEYLHKKIDKLSTAL